MFFHDLAHDIQAQPGAFAGRLGGEEGIEDLLANFRRDAAASIGDRHQCVVAVATQAQGQAALVVHRLQRVMHQVGPHLVYFVGQATYWRQVFKVPHQVDAVLDLVLVDGQHRFQAFAQVRLHPYLHTAETREGFQREDDFRDPVHRGVDVVGIGGDGGDAMRRIQDSVHRRMPQQRQHAVDVRVRLQLHQQPGAMPRLVQAQRFQLLGYRAHDGAFLARGQHGLGLAGALDQCTEMQAMLTVELVQQQRQAQQRAVQCL